MVTEEPPSERVSSEGSPALVVIGNFDGVHQGHKEVLRFASRLAESRGLCLRVLTFDPHPVVVLRGQAIPLLCAAARKVAWIREVCPEANVEVLPFTQELSKLTPSEFVSDILIRKLGARTVVVGQNFRFGRDRAGDLSTLTELGRALDLEALTCPLLEDGQGAISSTRIRGALNEGEMGLARELLGRYHQVTGRVVKGDGRGKALGIPTANLEGVAELLPSHGVYAAWVKVESGTMPPGDSARAAAASYFPAAVNLGPRPTLDRPASFEVHLLDQERDLYGASLSVYFVRRIRPVKKFADVDELVAQIHRDLLEVRAELNVAGLP